jgi:type II secretory pathway pseudopilin PulG
MNFSLHSRRGQTLVEALVALSILTVGFVGIVTLLTKSFQLNRTTSNDTQATYLAAEGIEVAKNIIDYDVYYGLAQSSNTDDWGCSFKLNAGQSADYALEYDATPTQCAKPMAIPQDASDKLYFNPNTDLYVYSYNDFGATPTDFTRDIRVSVPASSPDELDVQSTVVWTDGAVGNTITLEDHFYNWHQ